jgi:hypothetical protein
MPLHGPLGEENIYVSPKLSPDIPWRPAGAYLTDGLRRRRPRPHEYLTSQTAAARQAGSLLTNSMTIQRHCICDPVRCAAGEVFGSTGPPPVCSMAATRDAASILIASDLRSPLFKKPTFRGAKQHACRHHALDRQPARD